MQTLTDLEQFADLALVFSNQARLRILGRLLAGACIVGDLVQATGLEQAVISKQLGLLRSAGLLACQPQGRCREYRLAQPEAVAACLETLAQLGAACARNRTNCPKLDVRRPRTRKSANKEVLS